MQNLWQQISSSDEPVFIDTETSWTDDYDARYLMGTSIVVNDKGYYIPVGHKAWIDDPTNMQIPSHFFSEVKTPVFHNPKFDLQVKEKAGSPIPTGNVMDTIMMAHYVAEDQISFELDNLARVYDTSRKATGISKTMKANWDNMPVVAMGTYAIQDTFTTRDLYYKLLPKYEQYAHLWEETDRDFMLLLLEMERKGLRVDLAQASLYEEQCQIRMDEISAEIGIDISKPSQLLPKLFGDPPFGYGLKPLSYTPKTGKPQVTKQFLERTNHPVCGLLIEYRALAKQVQSYFRPYQKFAASSGVLHPSFKMHGTKNGRLSCADPNLQQLPRDQDTSPVKKLFLPDEGKVLVEIDYSNLEMRLMTAYAQQPALHEEFSKRNGDVHGRVAEELGIGRFKAKTVNFLIGYGGGSGVLANQLNIPEREANKILTAYKAKYKEIFVTSAKAQMSTEKNNGIVRMWHGRERHFRFPSEYHNAFNSVIQGGSFEIVKRSMLRLEEAGYDMRNQVHDSVWIMFDEATWKEDAKGAEKIMEATWEEEFGLPFFVESKNIHG